MSRCIGILSFNEEVIGRLRILPLTETRFFASFRFAPIEQLCTRLDAHGIALLKESYWLNSTMYH